MFFVALLQNFQFYTLDNWNVLDFKYTIKASIMFNSRVVLRRIDFEHKCLLIKLGKKLNKLHVTVS